MTGDPTFGFAERGHLGEAVAALVDGVLSHTDRDHALAHIAHCGSCRAEVDAQRQLKLRLNRLGDNALDVPVSLTAALLALSAPSPIAGPKAVVRMPAYLPHHRVRVAAGASLLVAASVGVLLAVGGGDQDPGQPVQPPIATLVDQHAATTGDVPLDDPGFVAATAGFVR